VSADKVNSSPFEVVVTQQGTQASGKRNRIPVHWLLCEYCVELSKIRRPELICTRERLKVCASSANTGMPSKRKKNIYVWKGMYTTLSISCQSLFSSRTFRDNLYLVALYISFLILKRMKVRRMRFPCCLYVYKTSECLISLYEIRYLYYGTYVRLKDVLHKALPACSHKSLF
jgi:hypothetical protein